MQIYHNPKCSNSLRALAQIQSHGIEPEIIEYLQSSLEVDQLQKVVEKLALPVIGIVRTRESVWVEQFHGNKYSDEELLAILVEHPVLLQRPIVVTNTQAVIARPPEKVLQIL